MKRAFFLLLLCICLLVATEIILRFYLYAKYGNKIYLSFRTKVETSPKDAGISSGFVGYSGYYKMRPGKFALYTINASGFRNADVSPKRPDEFIRICALGGSTTFGDGAKDDETYPRYLEEILNVNKKGKKFEVINCGIPRYKMEEVYNLFEKEVIHYEPDLIIVFSAYNDAFSPFARQKTLLWKTHHLFYYRWMLYTILLEKYSTWKHKHPVPFFLVSKQIPQDYDKYLKSLISLTEAKGIKVVLVRQPMNPPEDDDISGDYSLSQLENMYEKANNLNKQCVIAQHYYVAQMTKIGQEKGLLVVDPIEAFSKSRELLFVDSIHLKPLGNKILAEIIAKELLIKFK